MAETGLDVRQPAVSGRFYPADAGLLRADVVKFLGGEGTSPSVGRAGREERVAELRLETVFPAERQDEVIAALRQAHPYEEPAFDIYELLS